jgi:hypothetical protein
VPEPTGGEPSGVEQESVSAILPELTAIRGQLTTIEQQLASVATRPAGE